MPSYYYFGAKSSLTEGTPFELQLPDDSVIVSARMNERTQDWDENADCPVGGFYSAITIDLLGDPEGTPHKRTFVVLSRERGSVKVNDKQRLVFVLHFNKVSREGFDFVHPGFDLCEIVHN